MKTASIYNNIEFNKDKAVINVLFDTPFTKEIRIAMHKGTIMKEHQTPFPIVVEIVDGAIEFGVKGEILQLAKGDLIALNGSVPHNLMAKENSIIRLTLNKQDKAERVQNVATN